MARYIGPKSKIARRFGEPIFGADKVLSKRNFPPGQHGNNRRRKQSEYAVMLAEKQKAKYTYGVLERQFRNMFEKAAKADGITGEVLLQNLESRLDNVVFRLGIAPTRAAARQLVGHKHITVDGQVVNIPSFSVKPGMVVGVREKSKSLEVIEAALAGYNHSKYPWIEWDQNTKSGKFLHKPERADIPENIKEQLIVDIGKYLTGFEVLNPDLVICHLDVKATMQIDLTINKGRGYVTADENRAFCTDVNVIPIDSIYTPIRNVKYSVEPYRVEMKTDYDKLVLEVTTDGSIHPKDALKEAAKILIQHFMLFSDEKITLESPEHEGNQEFDEEVLHMRQLLKTKLVDMNLSVRALNCLKAADVETLGDLVQYNKTDLLKFRNFGKKSLSELDDLLESLNLSFGTN